MLIEVKMLKGLLLKLYLKLFKYIRFIESDEIKLIHIPNIPDERDYVVKLDREVNSSIANVIIYNPDDFIKNQGNLGSCASHAATTALEIMQEVNNTQFKGIPLSELYHYWWGRQEDYHNSFPEDSGMTSRDMLKVLQQKGICPEKLCPYITLLFNEQPKAFTDGFAKLWKINHYFNVYDIETAKEIIDSGYPVLVGFYVTASFLNFSPTVEINPNETRRYGGHEVVIIGYNDISQEFLCINSWGRSYKEGGLMRVPYEYYNRHGIDMWTFNI